MLGRRIRRTPDGNVMKLKTTISALVAAATVTFGMSSAPANGAAVPINATAASDWSGDGRADVVAPTADGRLWLYRGDGAGGFAGAASLISQGWSGRDQIRLVGNWDGVAGTDLIARDAATGALWLYSGNGAGGIRQSRTIGAGWQVFSHIFSPGDWDGDGHPDLLATVRSDGTLRLYRGNGTGGLLGSRVIGRGWGGLDGLMTTGDFDGNASPDFLARNRANGQLLLYRSNGSGGFAPTQVVGAGWNGFTGLLGVGDWSGDGHSDVLARLGDGTLRMYRGNGTGGWISPYPTIGTGWNWNGLRFPDQAATSSPAACTPVWSSSAPMGTWTVDPYAARNNMWSGDAGPQTISACSWHQWSVVSNQPGTGTDDGVKTYPDTQRIVNLPLSSLTSLPSTFDVTTPAGGGVVPANGKQWDAAYDLWLDNYGTEVMVWNNWTMHWQYWWNTYHGIQVSIDGVAYHAYRNSDGNGLWFVRDQVTNKGSVDLGHVLAWAVAHGWLRSSQAVNDIEYGFEVAYTGTPTTFTLNDYTLSVPAQ
jgi:hypothetical protein